MSKLTRLTGVLVVALAATAGATPAWSQSAEADLARASGGPQFIPDEVLVKFRPGTSAADKANARGLANASVVEVVTTPLMKSQGTGDLELVRLPPGLTVARAMGRLKGSFVVEYAEPNWVYYHDATANDPYYTNGSLWGVYGDATSPANQYGSQAGEAWAAPNTGSSTVYVGIIDEGYMYMHEDLAANAGTNPGEIAGNAGTTTGTVTSMTSTAGTSTATTTRLLTAHRTITARMSPVRSARSEATARELPASYGTSSC